MMFGYRHAIILNIMHSNANGIYSAAHFVKGVISTGKGIISQESGSAE